MLIERIRAEFKRRINKLDSNHNKDYPIAFIDDLFNLKQLEFIDLVVGGNQNKFYKEGIQTTQLSTDLISNLIIKDKEILPYKTSKEYVEFILPKDYLHLQNITVTTDCGVFTEISFAKELFLNSSKRSSVEEPSKRWKRTYYTLNKTSDNNTISLYVYFKNFEVLAINIDYVKKPKPVFSGLYDTLEYLSGDETANTASSDKVDSELQDKAANYVIDLMVDETYTNLKDQLGKQFSQQKLITNQ